MDRFRWLAWLALLACALAPAGVPERPRFRVAGSAQGLPSTEIKALARFADCITVHQFGRGCFLLTEPAPEDRAAARRGLDGIRRALVSGDYDLVIADEANVAVALGLIEPDDLVALIDLRPEQVELVLTGRGAPDAVLTRADLVTEMRCVRHYYDRGVLARPGIES